MDLLLTFDWWVVAILAAIAGVARGLSGFGIGLIMMPIGGALLTPAFMVPVLSILDSPASVFLLAEAWKRIDKRDVLILASAAAVCMPAGIWILTYVEAGTVAVCANAVALATAVALLAGLRLRGAPSLARSMATGGLSGVLQGAAALPGPPIILGWVAAQIPGPALRANIIAYFALIDALVVPMLWISGLFTVEVLWFGASLLPLYLGGVLIGRKAFGLISEGLFRRVVLGLVILGALSGIVVVSLGSGAG